MASSPSSVLSPSRPETRLGRETPRIFTPPLRALTPQTSLGFALIEFASAVLGVELLPWQRWLAIHALELLPDGTFRFRTVLVLVARQNGKSTFLQVLALFFLYCRGVPLVIGTAQNLDIAEEVWQGAVDIAENVPDLAAEIQRVTKVNGKKALELRHGERYKVQAANRRGGRGLSGDLVMLDELREHQTWDAWGAVTKTTLARTHAQVWAASNAGDAASVVLSFLRESAHAALGDPDGIVSQVPSVPDDVDEVEDDSLGIFEWSAPPGIDIRDRDGWTYANPSLGHTITERAIASALRTDPESVFRTEVLCQWVVELAGSVIPTWPVLMDIRSTAVDPVTFGIDTSPNPETPTSSISVAGAAPDGRVHVETVDNAGGSAWVVSRMVELVNKWRPQAVVVDPRSAAGNLIPDLRAAGIEVTEVTTAQYAQACGKFTEIARTGGMTHRGYHDPEMSSAVAGAKTRPLGDAWAWDRKRPGADITPLVAATLALWGHANCRNKAIDLNVW